MSDARDKRLEQLRQARESGLLDDDTYRAAVEALGGEVGMTASVTGSGAVAQGAGAVAAGAGGVAIHGDVHGDVRVGSPGAREEAAEEALEKIKVLVLAANPVDEDNERLALDEEIRNIREKIRASDYRDSLELVPWLATRPGDLLEALNEVKPHVVHFAGHGDERGRVLLVDESGKSKPLSGFQLAPLFAVVRDNLRLVFLNLCHSHSLARALTADIDFAIGMRGKMGDEAARIFAGGFYRAIGFGRSVQAAFDEGVAALTVEGALQGHVPQLFSRAGIDPSSVRLVSGEPRKRRTRRTARPTSEDSQAFALRTAYLQRVLQETSYLPLSGIDPKAAADAKAQLALNAVYTGLLTLTPEEGEYELRPKAMEKKAARLREPDRATRRLSAVAQLDRHDHLVLLGDPGSGKTTFVNFVAMCLSGEALKREDANLRALTAPLPDEEGKDEEKRQPWKRGAPLPIRVVLREFAAVGLPKPGARVGAMHLCDFVAEELRRADLGDCWPFLREELQERGGLLLLDGLDEVPEADQRREQIKQVVSDFCKTYGNCRVLITSRTYAYQKQEWRLPGFAEAVLAPFSRGQIRRFVDRWYAYYAEIRGLRPEDGQGRAEVLKRRVLENDRLRDLAERPLLLALMASLHAWRGGSLPEKREELYADAVELLLDLWESWRVVRDAEGKEVIKQPSLVEFLKVGKDKVLTLLCRLAHEAHSRQADLTGTADIAEGDLLAGLMHLAGDPSAVNPVKLVDYLSQRAGVLVPRGVGVYTFPHRMFQEYLSACYFTSQPDHPEGLAGLAREDPNRWREVALLARAKSARGQASNIWDLTDALCPEGAGASLPDLWGAQIAGQALVETADLKSVHVRHQPKLQRVRKRLVAIVQGNDFPAVERVAAGVSLAHLGDPRFREDAWFLPKDELLGFVEVPEGPFLMGERDNQHKPVLPAYYLGRYPVTNAQYAAFMEAGGYGEPRYWPEARKAKVWKDGSVKGWLDDGFSPGRRRFGSPFDLPNHPIAGVCWYEALAYCRWLTEQMRDSDQCPKPLCRLLSEGWSVTLPSEAEWEKAARGDDGRLYPWAGEPDPNRANYDDTGIGTTSAVGCFPLGESLYHCLDMSGNVWEWTRSKYKEYPYRHEDGREQLDESDDERVLRGGAFNFTDGDCRCACRDGGDPGDRNGLVGFRLALSPFQDSGL